jgi:hypothetical protein
MYAQMTSVGCSCLNTQFYDTKPSGGEVVFEQDARLYEACIGVYDGILYLSNGASWNQLDFGILDSMADLDTGTAILSDVTDAYNLLLEDLHTKGWML